MRFRRHHHQHHHHCRPGRRRCFRCRIASLPSAVLASFAAVVSVTAFPSVFAAALPATAILVAVAVASTSAADVAPSFLASAAAVSAAAAADLAAADLAAAADLTAAVISAAAALSTAATADIAADFGLGPEVVAMRRRGALQSGEFQVCLLPPTSGLTRRRRQRGAQLDGELAFYAYRRRLRAWAAEGGAAGREVGFLSLLPPTSGLARVRRRKQPGQSRSRAAAYETGSLHRILFPSRPLLRAWVGGVGGGARLGTKSLLPCASRHRLRADGGLARSTAAAAGSCWTCWRSQECSALSPSRLLCCRLCLSQKKKSGMERSGPTPSDFHRAGWPGGSCTGGVPTAAAERRLCCWTASHYICALCADSTCPFYPIICGLLAGGCASDGPGLPGLLRLAGPLA